MGLEEGWRWLVGAVENIDHYLFFLKKKKREREMNLGHYYPARP